MLGTRMSKTLGCVLLSADVTSTSNRTAAFASRALAHKPLVDWVVRRGTDAQMLSEVVVIIPGDVDAERCRALIPPDAEVFVSNKKDALAQVCDCLDSYPADSVVFIPIESPLVDPGLIDRLIATVDRDPSVEYATFRSTEGRQVLQAQLGLIAEYCAVGALRVANRSARAKQDRANPTRYIQGHPEEFCLRLIPVPAELDRDDLRLSIKNQDDWDHAEQIVEVLGTDDLDWQRIAQLLERNPDLRRRMADLNRDEIQQSIS